MAAFFICSFVAPKSFALSAEVDELVKTFCKVDGGTAEAPPPLGVAR